MNYIISNRSNLTKRSACNASNNGLHQNAVQQNEECSIKLSSKPLPVVPEINQMSGLYKYVIISIVTSNRGTCDVCDVLRCKYIEA